MWQSFSIYIFLFMIWRKDVIMANKKEVVKKSEGMTVSGEKAQKPSVKKAVAKTAPRKRELKPLDFHSAVEFVRKSIKQTSVKKITDKISAEVTLTGDAAGIFYIEIIDGAVAVEPYDYVDKDIVVMLDSQSLELVRAKQASFLELFNKGKVHVYGDVAKAVKLLSVLK